MKKSCFVFVSLFFVALNLQANFLKDFVIYGEDDRHEVADQKHYGKSWQQAKSVALVLEKNELRFTNQSKYVEVLTQTLQQKRRVCPSERFAQQKTAGFCSAFLLSKDLVVTAGHCLFGHETCKDLVFAFGLKKEEHASARASRLIQREKVYSCKEVLYHSDEVSGEFDLALLRLDRIVQGGDGLPLATHSALNKNSQFYMIGHPLGLSQKISLGGTLLENFEAHYFSSDLDSYSFSSGSPVFNDETGFVEGVLIRGQEDFVERDGCYVSSVCEGPLCLGELILRSSVIEEVIASLELSNF